MSSIVDKIIKIPFKTPSTNHLYFTWNNRRILTSPARKLKAEIKELVKDSIDTSLMDTPLKVSVEVHENWWYKNGKVKRVDVANREKFLIDSVFEGLKLEDKYIFDHQMKKVQSSEEFAVIEITPYVQDTSNLNNANKLK